MQESANIKDRVIITVVGKDAVGIIAKVTTFLSDNNINVLDISQTIVGGFFNMMMIADLATGDISFDECRTNLKSIGEKIGVEIRIQREEIFEKMHRI